MLGGQHLQRPDHPPRRRRGRLGHGKNLGTDGRTAGPSTAARCNLPRRSIWSAIISYRAGRRRHGRYRGQSAAAASGRRRHAQQPGGAAFASTRPAGLPGARSCRQGTLRLGSADALSGVSSITIAAGATLDVAAVGGFQLGATTPQRLEGTRRAGQPADRPVGRPLRRQQPRRPVRPGRLRHGRPAANRDRRPAPGNGVTGHDQLLVVGSTAADVSLAGTASTCSGAKPAGRRPATRPGSSATTRPARCKGHSRPCRRCDRGHLRRPAVDDLLRRRRRHRPVQTAATTCCFSAGAAVPEPGSWSLPCWPRARSLAARSSHAAADPAMTGVNRCESV